MADVWMCEVLSEGVCVNCMCADLKPANILLFDGCAKVCDFGLAKSELEAQDGELPLYDWFLLQVYI